MFFPFIAIAVAQQISAAVLHVLPSSGGSEIRGLLAAIREGGLSVGGAALPAVTQVPQTHVCGSRQDAGRHSLSAVQGDALA